MRVHMVETGIANTASVRAAFERLGATVVPATCAADVANAAALVLPGVGSFGAAVRSLGAQGLVEPLRERALSGAPMLAICLGLQLLATESAESPGIRGLGVLSAPVLRLAAPRLPHFGWSPVSAPAGCELLASGHAYFAHSYALTDIDALEGQGFRVAAAATEGVPFVAAVEREGLVACQFHPELSGRAGAQLLVRWLARASVQEASR